ncbi:hypothetical protein QBC41DRAFT_16707 [Cercophora samala]|uniref:Uncharacterized protein n=1 Tax=Cercophora samala TaxID=330535 RepID=A0AA39Z7Y8_9PEZI|nr:hypothetical protein QBC41DRAFT_16707 [Cercophora samala]
MDKATISQGNEALGLSEFQEEELDELLDISSKRKNLWYLVLENPAQCPCFLLCDRTPPTAPAPASASQIQQPVRHRASATHPGEAHLYELTTNGVKHTVFDSLKEFVDEKGTQQNVLWTFVGSLRYRLNFEHVLDRAVPACSQNNSANDVLAYQLAWVKTSVALLADPGSLTMFTHGDLNTPQSGRQDATDTQQHQEQSQTQSPPAQQERLQDRTTGSGHRLQHTHHPIWQRRFQQNNQLQGRVSSHIQRQGPQSPSRPQEQFEDNLLGLDHSSNQQSIQQDDYILSNVGRTQGLTGGAGNQPNQPGLWPQQSRRHGQPGTPSSDGGFQ